MPHDIDVFLSGLKFKIEPAYLQEGDRTAFGDFNWSVKKVSRSPDGTPLYSISHWVAGIIHDVPQAKMEFLPVNAKNPIWSLDIYHDGRSVLHNEDIVPHPNEHPLAVSINISRWPNLAFINWLEDFIFDPLHDAFASIFLTLRTHRGHYIDGWYFQDAIPTKQRKSENNWNVCFDYWKKSRIKPPFDLPKVYWIQYAGEDGEWMGAARAADIEVIREGRNSELAHIGRIYQSDYRILCVDYLK